MAEPAAGHLIVGIYGSDQDATTVLDTIKRMHHADNITLIDAAKITKDAAGKVHIQEVEELTAKKGAIRGAVVTGIFGLIFPPSAIISAAVGGGIGALIGRARDSGIKSGKLRELAKDLTPDAVAIASLVDERSTQSVENAMKAMSGKLVVQPISDDELKRLYIEQQTETDAG
jgi:uncharacterized membrane protein